MALIGLVVMAGLVAHSIGQEWAYHYHRGLCLVLPLLSISLPVIEASITLGDPSRLPKKRFVVITVLYGDVLFHLAARVHLRLQKHGGFLAAMVMVQLAAAVPMCWLVKLSLGWFGFICVPNGPRAATREPLPLPAQIRWLVALADSIEQSPWMGIHVSGLL